MPQQAVHTVTCPVTPSRPHSWHAVWGGCVFTFLRVLGRRRGSGQQLSVQTLDLSVLSEHKLLEAADLCLQRGGGTDEYWHHAQASCVCLHVCLSSAPKNGSHAHL